MKNWKEWALIKPFFDFYHSFFNNDMGFSFRKCGAAFAIYTAGKISLSIQDQTMKFYVCCAWMVFAAVCIGLVTIPQLIQFLSDKKGTITETVKTETVNETTKV